MTLQPQLTLVIVKSLLQNSLKCALHHYANVHLETTKLVSATPQRNLVDSALPPELLLKNGGLNSFVVIKDTPIFRLM